MMLSCPQLSRPTTDSSTKAPPSPRPRSPPSVLPPRLASRISLPRWGRASPPLSAPPPRLSYTLFFCRLPRLPPAPVLRPSPRFSRRAASLVGPRRGLSGRFVAPSACPRAARCRALALLPCLSALRPCPVLPLRCPSLTSRSALHALSWRRPRRPLRLAVPVGRAACRHHPGVSRSPPFPYLRSPLVPPSARPLVPCLRPRRPPLSCASQSAPHLFRSCHPCSLASPPAPPRLSTPLASLRPIPVAVFAVPPRLAIPVPLSPTSSSPQEGRRPRARCFALAAAPVCGPPTFPPLFLCSLY